MVFQEKEDNAKSTASRPLKILQKASKGNRYIMVGTTLPAGMITKSRACAEVLRNKKEKESPANKKKLKRSRHKQSRILTHEDSRVATDKRHRRSQTTEEGEKKGIYSAGRERI